MNKVLYLVILFVVSFSVLLLQGSTAHAQLSTDMANQLKAAGMESGQASATGVPEDPRVIVMRIVRVALSFLGTVFLCLIIYAGFLWMTAGGNEENIEKAKKLLSRAVIGLVIILSSYSITIILAKVALGQYTSYDNGPMMKPLVPTPCGDAGFPACP